MTEIKQAFLWALGLAAGFFVFSWLSGMATGGAKGGE